MLAARVTLLTLQPRFKQGCRVPDLFLIRNTKAGLALLVTHIVETLTGMKKQKSST